MNLPHNLVGRYVEASKKIASINSTHIQQERIARLRDDVNAFRRDLRRLDAGTKFIFIPDSAEIGSYIQPNEHLGYYCFPIEDRARYDFEYAKRRQRNDAYDEDNYLKKLARRVLRARRHLFSPTYHNILIPPHLSELEASLSVIMMGEIKDLDPVFVLMEDYVRKLQKEGGTLADEIKRILTVDQETRQSILIRVFESVVEHPSLFSTDMNLGKRKDRISNIARAKDFLINTKSYGVEDYPWQKVIKAPSSAVIDRLRNIRPDKVQTTYIENLFYKLPKSRPSSLSLYTDARALAYVAAFNECLQSEGLGDIRVQLVTWAIAPVTVARTFWHEASDERDPASAVEVRHPKLLAASVDFRTIDRAEVESDLDRLSQALHLYETTTSSDIEAQRQKKLEDVRAAWSNLDNTLLAWTTPIEKISVENKSDASNEKILEIYRQAVAENRSTFERYLASRISELSRELSDSHWNVVQPENVTGINADCLLYKEKNYVVIRPMPDQPRCAIALHNTRIVETIYDSFVNKTSFGQTLLQLTQIQSADETGQESDIRTFRSETQLLKAFLFVIRADYVMAANYCRLARTELRSSVGSHGQITSAEAAKATRVLAEVSYLAHYSHRNVGMEKRNRHEFETSLRFLKESQGSLEARGDELSELLQPRYDISWIKTCVEIAAADFVDWQFDVNEKERISIAYKGCLDQLSVINIETHADKLKKYHMARAAQTVMQAFIFDRHSIGSWRVSFGNIIQPGEQHARMAWEILRSLKETQVKGQLPVYSARVDRLYLIGQFWFGETLTDRENARRDFEKVKGTFDDPAMRLVMDALRRKPFLRN